MPPGFPPHCHSHSRGRMTRPLAVRRHNEIVQRLRAAGSVSVGELANIFGTGTATGIDSVRADIAFIGVGGFAEDGGMTDYSIIAAETRGKMILAGRAYLLADHTKLTRRTPFRVPNMNKCAGVIVDRMPDRALATAWNDFG